MCYRDNFIYRIYCSVKQCNIKILLWLKHFYDSWRIDEQMDKPRSIQTNNKEKEKQIGKQRDKSINPCHFHSVVKFFHFDPYNVCTYPTLFVSPPPFEIRKSNFPPKNFHFHSLKRNAWRIDASNKKNKF